MTDMIAIVPQMSEHQKLTQEREVWEWRPGNKIWSDAFCQKECLLWTVVHQKRLILINQPAKLCFLDNSLIRLLATPCQYQQKCCLPLSTLLGWTKTFKGNLFRKTFEKKFFFPCSWNDYACWVVFFSYTGEDANTKDLFKHSLNLPRGHFLLLPRSAKVKPKISSNILGLYKDPLVRLPVKLNLQSCMGNVLSIWF